MDVEEGKLEAPCHRPSEEISNYKQTNRILLFVSAGAFGAILFAEFDDRRRLQNRAPAEP